MVPQIQSVPGGELGRRSPGKCKLNEIEHNEQTATPKWNATKSETSSLSGPRLQLQYHLPPVAAKATATPALPGRQYCLFLFCFS